MGIITCARLLSSSFTPTRRRMMHCLHLYWDRRRGQAVTQHVMQSV